MNRVRGESAGHNDRRHKHCGAQIRKFFGNGGDRFLTDFFLNGFLSGIDRYQPDNQKEFEVEEGVQ
jgi:hypothetical protein